MRTDSHSQLLNMCVIGITSCINLACIFPLRSSNSYSSTNDEHSRALNWYWFGTFNITMIHSTCKIFQGFPWSRSKASASFQSPAVPRLPPAFRHLQYPGFRQLSVTCSTQASARLSVTCSTQASTSFPSLAVPRPPPAFHHMQYTGLRQLSVTCSTQASTSFPSLAGQYCPAFRRLQDSIASDGKLGAGLGRRLDVLITLFRKCKTNSLNIQRLRLLENMKRQFITNFVTRMDEPE